MITHDVIVQPLTAGCAVTLLKGFSGEKALIFYQKRPQNMQICVVFDDPTKFDILRSVHSNMMSFLQEDSFKIALKQHMMPG